MDRHTALQFLELDIVLVIEEARRYFIGSGRNDLRYERRFGFAINAHACDLRLIDLRRVTLAQTLIDRYIVIVILLRYIHDLLLADLGKIIELGSDNMVMGVDPNEVYTQSLVDMRSGDTLLLYTDGLMDAMNFENERFGRERIVEVFSQGGVSAEANIDSILWAMRKFTGLAKPTDDVTMIVAKVE